jgi:hypothetical protein
VSVPVAVEQPSSTTAAPAPREEGAETGAPLVA